MADVALVLVVEDEQLIGTMVADALEEAGFHVASVSNGSEALRLLQERGDDVRCLVTDINLGAAPDGWVIAARAREMAPQLPVVYTTGDSAADWPSKGVPNSLVVPKPYVPAQIITAVASQLTIG
jgi:CheY-like chemotaxis protein